MTPKQSTTFNALPKTGLSLTVYEISQSTGHTDREQKAILSELENKGVVSSNGVHYWRTGA